MKVLKALLRILLGIVAVVIVAVACIWGKEIATMATVHQVGDNPYLYKMKYKANYDLDKVVDANIDSNEKLLSFIVSGLAKGIPVNLGGSEKADTNVANCTSFQAKAADQEGFYFGRNYDFFKNPSLVTVNHPKKGYASISTSDMSHLGYGMDKLPDSFVKKALCLAAIYTPVDGMNEKGLVISIMALPKQPSQQNTGKNVVGTTIIMRLILDRCATVQEALDLVSQYDIRHDVKAGSGYHYLVADATGDCAAIEFDPNDGWKTMIVRKPAEEKHMLITNHLLDPKYYTTEPNEITGNPHSKSWWRYETAQAFLTGREGVVTREEAQECLAQVHWKDLVWENGMVEDTQFSNVYDQTNLKVYLRSWYDYDTTCEFSLF